MTRQKSQDPSRRDSRSRPGILFSDEYLVGLSRGGYFPSSFRSRGGRAGPREITPTFEETYPKHAFSTLVRLSVGVAGWLARVLTRRSHERPAAQAGRPDSGARAEPSRPTARATLASTEPR